MRDTRFFRSRRRGLIPRRASECVTSSSSNSGMHAAGAVAGGNVTCDVTWRDVGAARWNHTSRREATLCDYLSFESSTGTYLPLSGTAPAQLGATRWTCSPLPALARARALALALAILHAGAHAASVPAPHLRHLLPSHSQRVLTECPAPTECPAQRHHQSSPSSQPSQKWGPVWVAVAKKLIQNSRHRQKGFRFHSHQHCCYCYCYRPTLPNAPARILATLVLELLDQNQTWHPGAVNALLT